MHTIRGVLNNNSLQIDNSVYEEAKMLDFPISARGEFGVFRENPEKASYEKIIKYQSVLNEMKQDEEYLAVCDKLKSSSRPGTETDVVNTAIETITDSEKKELRKRKKELTEKFISLALEQVFPAVKNGEIFSVSYKGGVKAVDFMELARSSSTWNGNEYEILQSYPWFCTDLEQLKTLFSSGRPIGIEGGSCLIGTDELYFHVKTNDGSHRIFDFNTMQEICAGAECLTEEVTGELANYVRDNIKNIEDIWVECPKEKITIDEWETLQNLFLLAYGLNANLVVTIPDFSYKKTFVEIFSNLPKTLYEPLAESYERETKRLTMMSIRWIEHFKKKYSNVTCEILSGAEDSSELYALFHEKRKKYLNEYVMKHLTNRDVTEEALMDYICMPATPFYLWGIKDIIEVNRLEEYPSIEKCRRMHNPDMNLHAMLYPQRLSSNGHTSNFYADREHKIYIDEDIDKENL